MNLNGLTFAVQMSGICHTVIVLVGALYGSGMAIKRNKRPRDPIQLAKLIGDIATGQTDDGVEDGRDAAASEFMRQGGRKGGAARAKKLSAEQRTEIARIAANARWKKSY